eukprot:TRINITY_DN19481_c0_g1_i3.p1 TRINITY_DN19481_c0_g1~~TRINITY_DN19481_c0_g1_i3.p1  ORF type:complete len:526 (+),score=92.73 TRINITY_DN19481_c0_g1_i3:125-1702(+)
MERGDVRVGEYQRNVAFAGFILVLCFAGLVFLSQSLEQQLVPLLWASFFSVPGTLVIDGLNLRIAELCSILKSWCRRGQGGSEPPSELTFTTQRSREYVVVDQESGVVSDFLHGVNRPCQNSLVPNWLCCFFRNYRRRVCIRELRAVHDPDFDLGPPVNRLVEHWCYYIKGLELPTAGEERRLQLFLDKKERRKAVNVDESGMASHTANVVLKGKLVLDQSSSMTWGCAFVLTTMLIALAVSSLVYLISDGVKNFTKNMDDYQHGVKDFLEWMKPVFKHLEDLGLDMSEFGKKAEDYVNKLLPQVAAYLASTLESFSFQALMFFIYLFFWIFEPLPMSTPIATVFKTYLLLKTIVCLLFAASMTLVLVILGCKIWALFFVLTFLLNFIPELGPIASAVLMIPAILFDGHVEGMDTRLANLFWLCVCFTIFKVITGNVIEVQLYASQGGQFMRMHPVVIVATMMVFYSVLGVTGMFLAVPVMAAVKYHLVSADMPDSILHPLLVFIEGDETGLCDAGFRRVLLANE